MKTGTFEAYAVDFEYTTSSNNNVQVGVRLHVPSESEYIRWYGTFTDKAREYTLAALAAMGWDGQNLDTLDGLGVACEIVVAEETYQGVTRTKVKYVNPIGGTRQASKGALSGDERKRFLASMRGHLLAWQQGQGVAAKPTVTTTQRRPPVDGDDDIPF